MDKDVYIEKVIDDIFDLRFNRVVIESFEVIFGLEFGVLVG